MSSFFKEKTERSRILYSDAGFFSLLFFHSLMWRSDIFWPLDNDGCIRRRRAHTHSPPHSFSTSTQTQTHGDIIKELYTTNVLSISSTHNTIRCYQLVITLAFRTTRPQGTLNVSNIFTKSVSFLKTLLRVELWLNPNPLKQIGQVSPLF